MNAEYRMDPKGESYVFDSWDEFLTRLHDEPNGVFKSRSSIKPNDTNGKNWAGSKDYATAEKLAREGWLGPVAQIEKVCGHVEERIDTSILQTTFDSRFDVAGGEVDVARYLDGEPECMIESTPIRISRHGRAVRVVIPGAYSSATSEKAILGRGAAVVALSDTLAKAQHPLEIWVCYAGAQEMRGKPIFQALVRVQRADEPIDIGRLGFALAHPSSLRRIGFRAVETLVKTSYVAKPLEWGYGTDPGGVDIRQLDEAENTIVVPSLSYKDRADWAKEEFCIQWVNDQLDRIFD